LPVLAPFNALLLPFSLSDLLSLHRAHAPPTAPVPLHTFALLSDVGGSSLPQRFRVGFLSADLRDHPVGRDLAVAFRALSLSGGVEVYAYAINRIAGEGDGEWEERDLRWAKAMRDNAASLVGLQGDTDAAAAARIAADRCHVLVDVMGYTRGNRREILALRPAPVLLAFKGYMSTTGAPHLALASDIVSTPPEFLPFYSEKVSNPSFYSSFS
ncbi:glycosyl transferase family 41-domain-containing protein, partial [Baffinella frigidus]